MRHNVADLLLSNSVSARRAASLFSDAAAAGAEGVGDLQQVGAPTHHHRNLLMKLLKGSKWPGLYFGRFRVWNRRSEQEEVTPVSFLLPHEIVRALFAAKQLGLLRATRNGPQRCCTHGHGHWVHGLDGTRGGARAVGLTGVVNKWDRSSSLEMVTMSFLGLVGRWANIRIPLFSMEHDWVMKAHTFDDILTIITWSLQQCCVG